MGGVVGEIIEGYRILRELGAGGMGRVVLAVHESTGREVAIKIAEDLGGEGTRRLENEARALCRVRSSHLPIFYDVVERGGTLCLVMEFIQGRSLAELWRQEVRWPQRLQRLQAALPGIVQGLRELYQVGVIHRDLKPDNLMVRSDGSGVVVDLGLAAAEDVARLTATGMIVGTPAFMAPEQLQGKAEFTPETDLYQLALVLVRLLSARPIPDQHEAIQEVVRVQREGAEFLLQDLAVSSPEFLAWLRGAMAPEAGRRVAAERGLSEVVGIVEGIVPVARSAGGVGDGVAQSKVTELDVVERRLNGGAGAEMGSRLEARKLIPKGWMIVLVVVGVFWGMLGRESPRVANSRSLRGAYDEEVLDGFQNLFGRIDRWIDKLDSSTSLVKKTLDVGEGDHYVKGETKIERRRWGTFIMSCKAMKEVLSRTRYGSVSLREMSGGIKKKMRSLDSRLTFKKLPKFFFPYAYLDETLGQERASNHLIKTAKKFSREASVFLEKTEFTGWAATAIRETNAYFEAHRKFMETRGVFRFETEKDTQLILDGTEKVLFSWARALENFPNDKAVQVVARFSSYLVADKATRVPSLLYWRKWLGEDPIVDRVVGEAVCHAFLSKFGASGENCGVSGLFASQTVKM
jgi:predicted Ser/Thr protein kinase